VIEPHAARQLDVRTTDAKRLVRQPRQWFGPSVAAPGRDRVWFFPGDHGTMIVLAGLSSATTRRHSRDSRAG
jgi:hypothetical protein